MYHGMINVYKEKGFTSHDVVAKLRGICKQKKIGHTGTLDPDAVGVLPVCLGSATKLCDMLTEKEKEYIAVLKLGLVTDTQDTSGTVLEEKEVNASIEEVREAILSFLGEYAQVPPMYSALKVNGKKLYELAREGKEVERAARPVVIHELEILEENMPEFTIRVRCSKGTYIRTLCHDIGLRLGCGGVMASLIRSKSGSFLLEEAYKLDEIQKLADEDRLSEIVIPVEKVFEKLPAVTVKEEAFKALANGNQLKKRELVLPEGIFSPEKEPTEGGMEKADAAKTEVRIYSHEGVFYGVYAYNRERRLFCPVKMFFRE